MFKLKIDKVKKITASLMVASFLTFSNPGVYALAQETPPTPPEAPTAPTAPENTKTPPTPPEAPTAPEDNIQAPEEPTAPTPPPNPYNSEDNNPTPAVQTTSPYTSASEGAGTNDSGNVGDTTISAGEVNNNSNVITTGNDNLSTGGSGNGSGSASVSNTGNGAGSSNTGSASVTNGGSTTQGNSAVVTNDLNQSSVSGQNNSSFNTGGDTTITTQDANTSGTVITAVNTNVDGVAVYEFNVADDHVGDIILGYNPANCVSGCGTPNTTVGNVDNGANSDNTATSDSSSNQNTDQTNDAAVTSNLTLAADSGNNDANFNTGGDSIINTGDANVNANVMTFANNNISGNVVLGVVNIYGDLVGDIILTAEALNAFCGNCLASGTQAQNSNNGAGSTNTATSNQSTTDNTNQFNDADIENNLIVYANSGDNSTSLNTDGSSGVYTGEANVDVNVVNIANTNISDGVWWLVIVNEAGKWVGKILGFPNGSNVAGSEGLEVSVDDSGQIAVTNSDNGAGSTNTASSDQTSDNSTNQENNAKIVNNVDLSANTGGNNANYNTGGSSGITTGDANIIANIVNFVNNNIVGTGKLFVTMVNVFGSWLGDFVGPGQTQEEASANQENNNGIGGAPNNQPDQQQNNSQNQDQGSDDNGTTTVSNPEANDANSGASITTRAYGNVLARIAGTSIKSNDSEESSEVAFAGSNVEKEIASRKVLNINLAWFLPVIPLLFIYSIAKRRKLALNALPRKGRNE